MRIISYVIGVFVILCGTWIITMGADTDTQTMVYRLLVAFLMVFGGLGLIVIITKIR